VSTSAGLVTEHQPVFSSDCSISIKSDYCLVSLWQNLTFLNTDVLVIGHWLDLQRKGWCFAHRFCSAHTLARFKDWLPLPRFSGTGLAPDGVPRTPVFQTPVPSSANRGKGQRGAHLHSLSAVSVGRAAPAATFSSSAPSSPDRSSSSVAGLPRRGAT
jgi:hypothetical protein